MLAGNIRGPAGVERTMRRALILLSLAGTMLPLWTVPSWACSCALVSRQELARSADVVFTGGVQAIDRGQGRVVAAFAPDLVFKGTVGGDPTVATASDGAACGFHFEEGRRYTVFASEHRGRLETGLCSGTKAGDIAAERFGLDAPRRVSTVSEPIGARDGWPLVWTAAGVALAGLAALILLRGRARA